MADSILSDALDRLGPEALRDEELLALVLRCEPEKARRVDTSRVSRVRH